MLSSLNWIDYGVIGILLFSILAGLMRGLIRETLGLLVWLIAFTVATLFATRLATVVTGLSASSDGSDSVSLLAISVSFVAIFVLILILGRLISYFLSAAVEGTGISFTNRLLGGIFGVLRGAVIVVFLMFLIDLTAFSKDPVWVSSQFVASFQPLVTWIEQNVSPQIDDLKAKVTAMRSTESSAAQVSKSAYVFDNS
jgi:membrane protein required for colicin V production